MKIFISAIFTFCLALAAVGQSPSKILKDAEKALGGSKSLQRLQSSIRIGRIKRLSDGTEGKYALQTVQPNLYNVSYDLAGYEVENGYNGRSGWARNSRDGLSTLIGQESLALQSMASYRNNLWLNYKKDKSKITAAGQATINGKLANVLNLTTQKGTAIKLLFDAASGLPIREEFPNGDVTEVTEFGDYRDVNGLKYPFFNRLSIGDKVYEIYYDTVRFNQSIAKSEFDFPVLSNEPLPEIPALLRDLRANEEKVEELLEKYSYYQKTTKRQLEKDGTLREKESETVQLSFYKGRRISRLIEKNGKPLSPREQAVADRDAAKRVEEIEKEVEKEESRLGRQASTGAPSGEGRRISIAEVLRASRLINPRRERFRGRDVIVFDFEPNPSFDFKNAKSMLKFFGKTAGVMWIDEKDKQVARLEAVLFESFKVGGGFLAKMNKGASFILEQERVNNEIWLPSQADINLSVRVLLVKGIDVNQVIKSYDYRRFETEVKDARVEDAKKP